MIPKVPGKVEVSPFCMVWGYKINDSYPAAIYTTVGIVCPFFFFFILEFSNSVGIACS